MPRMLLARIAETSADVAATSSRLAKVKRIAECLAEASPEEVSLEVDAAASRLQAITGKGSQAARREELAGVFSRATAGEQRLLVGLFLGELRQGALEGVMADAVAKAAEIPIADIRRAAMFAGDLRAVAAAAMRDGVPGLAQFRLTP